MARWQPHSQTETIYLRRVTFAVAAGAAAVTVLGATPSMPTHEKIEAILADR